MCVCSYVGEDLQDGESDHDRIWLADAKSIEIEGEAVVVF